MSQRDKQPSAAHSRLTESQKKKQAENKRLARSSLTPAARQAETMQKRISRTRKRKEKDSLASVLVEDDPDIVDIAGVNRSRSQTMPLQCSSSAIDTDGSTSGASIYPQEEQECLLYDVSIEYMPIIPVQTQTLQQPSTPTEPHIFQPIPRCQFCAATRFPHEPPNFCCAKGQISLYPIVMPTSLMDLYTSSLPTSVHFLQYIRAFNSLFSFTSFGVHLDPSYATNNRGIYTFRAQGQIYHTIRGLIPTADKHPSHLQLYFYDTEREVEHRMHEKSNLQPAVVEKIIHILRANPYSRFFRSLSSVPNLESYQIKLKADPAVTERTSALPTVSQVAALWIEDENSNSLNEREIIVHHHDHHSQPIRYYYGCYDPLQYPLLFPMGEPGWHRGIKRRRANRSDQFSLGQGQVLPCHANNADELIMTEQAVCDHHGNESGNVSAREYYAYRLQIRPTITAVLLEAGRLLQQYVVDMYVKVETSRLDYFRNHQTEIRADCYNGIVDSVHRGETEPNNIGRRIILPGSFIGGPRDMRKRYMDAITLVERYGKPDLFLTMTCNPKWKEILRELKPLELAQNRPDLLTRIFRAKFQELRKDIIQRKLFGKITAYTFVIEFQKRGLPHVHMLLIMNKKYKVNTARQIDAIIRAELPDQKTETHLYNMVVKHMMHGPCGAMNQKNVCMQNGACKSHYPRRYNSETAIPVDGYPLYQRRSLDNQVKVRGHLLDNRWVVPYNPYLLAKYDCHINVEVCSTVKAVKYLYKYIYKGHDKIIYKIASSVGNEDIDEIDQFQSARWVSPPEAIWRIYRFPLHEISPAIITLQLHLDGSQLISLRKNTNLNSIAENNFCKRTMLTQFFWMNKYNPRARSLSLLYKNFPYYFVWDVQSRTWTDRKQNEVIGRLATVGPNQGERYYLRLLLNHVHGPESYEHIRNVDGIQYSTNREAATALGLVQDDKSNEHCMQEAISYQMPIALRQLYCTILVHCNAVDPLGLFMKFEEYMAQDYVRLQQTNHKDTRQLLLSALALELESMGRNLKDYQLDQLVTQPHTQSDLCRDIRDELEVIISEQDLNSHLQLNVQQKNAYDRILDAVFNDRHTCFFIDGPGGTGKTYIYKAIIAAVRSQGKIALATASSGVAASILPNGRTAHSRFKIPIEGDGKLACNVSKQSDLAELLKRSSLIIWDEASMAKKQGIEALDSMLRDINNSDKLFGGKVVVLGGDFRQILPVIPKGTKEDCIDASIVRSYIWPLLENISLTVNMRARTDPSFSEYILRVGNGSELQNQRNQIKLPNAILLKPSVDVIPFDQLEAFVFPNFADFITNPLSLTDSAILTPKNLAVDEINGAIIDKFPGAAYKYLSFDETEDPTHQSLYIDFLNSVTPQGMPAHELLLKEHCPIVMLRNINPSKGLCNGTRLVCKSFTKNIIVAEVAVGQKKGTIVFIPRIPLKPNDPHLYPIEFTRRQFPIRLCFAMTINKAQGQTLNKVGIYLPEPVFAHGQLYVALSRATTAANIRILLNIEDKDISTFNYTENIVYRELLLEARCDILA